jgi:hypothetical protein
MSKPISYTLTKTAQGVRLSILPSETAHAQRQGFVTAGVSAAIGTLTLFLFGIGVLTIAVALLSFLVAAVFAWGVCERLARRELLFLPDRLILTSSIALFNKTRVVPLLSIDHFGFGNFGHSGTPVLKFTVADKWTVLACNVAEADANHLMQLLASDGVILPKSMQEAESCRETALP